MSESRTEPAAPETVDAIVAGLSDFDVLPREPLHAAVGNWDAVLPTFLERLEGYVGDPNAADVRDREALFFFIHLFGQMREARAYRVLMRFLSMDPDDVGAVLGDAITETLPRITISVFDGDPRPLEAVIENRDADEFVRSGLLKVLAFLTREGRVDPEHTKTFLRRCYDELEPQDESYVWVGWQEAISYLGLSEFKELVRKAFKTGRIEPTVMDFRDFEQDLRAVVEPESGVVRHESERLGYFGDTVEEFSSWYGFTEQYHRDRERLARQRLAEALEDPAEPWGAEPDLPPSEEVDHYWSFETRINPLRHVGRNDPCPCGSGKKYKKCCLK